MVQDPRPEGERFGAAIPADYEPDADTVAILDAEPAEPAEPAEGDVELTEGGDY